MEQQLSLFIRDEVMTWYTYFNKSQHADTLFRQHVLTNIDIVVSRAEHLSCRAQDKDRERVSRCQGVFFFFPSDYMLLQGGSSPPVPAVQTITSLVGFNPYRTTAQAIAQTFHNQISSATNPLNLAKQNTAYYPWF